MNVDIMYYLVKVNKDVIDQGRLLLWLFVTAGLLTSDGCQHTGRQS